MEETDKKQRNMLSLLLVLAVAGTAFFMFFYNASGIPPTPPPDDIDTDDDGVPDTQISFSIFQAMKLYFTDGTNAWKYPQSRTTLTPMTMTDLDTNKQVSSLQSFLYFTLETSKQVSYVTFSASASIDIFTPDKMPYVNIATMPISQMASNVQSKVDTYLISSTMTVSDFESILNTKGMAWVPVLYYVVSLRNINAEVHFADGTTKSFGLTGVQAQENWLWWKFNRVPNTYPYEVVSVETEWSWT